MPNKYTVPVIASYLLALLAAVVILKAGLLLALFSGLIVYSLVHLMTPFVEKKIRFVRARLLVIVVLAIVVISCLTALIIAAISFARSDAGSVHMMLQSMAGIIEASRPQIPAWVSNYLPNGSEALRGLMSDWFREHGEEAQRWGQEAGHSIIHLLMGMIIGGLIAVRDSHTCMTEFAGALQERAINLQSAFQRIVFAQVRISGINAALSSIYLLIILPTSGVHLPFSKTMVLITFVAGLLPVVGNIISNTVIVVVSLSHSVQIAFFSLCYMMVIHKLEYFLNAKIIGTQINAMAWELLIAILVMEAIFGIPGLVAAPVFYAWLKMELGMGCKRIR
ncbi:putative PurR-regulated permease PerM [Oxalobacteraceae bacterium GrIS 2.11]